MTSTPSLLYTVTTPSSRSTSAPFRRTRAATLSGRCFETNLATWPGAHWQPQRRPVTNDRCILEADFTATASTALEANGHTVPAGSSVRSPCVDILDICGGRISKKDTYIDVLGLLSPGTPS